MAESKIDPRPLFMITTHSYRFATASNSLGDGSKRGISAKNLGISAPEGYTYAGVRAFYTEDSASGAKAMNVYQIMPDGTTAMRVHNQYGVSTTNATAYMEVLWARSDYLDAQ